VDLDFPCHVELLAYLHDAPVGELVATQVDFFHLSVDDEWCRQVLTEDILKAAVAERKLLHLHAVRDHLAETAVGYRHKIVVVHAQVLELGVVSVSYELVDYVLYLVTPDVQPMKIYLVNVRDGFTDLFEALGPDFIVSKQ